MFQWNKKGYDAVVLKRNGIKLLYYRLLRAGYTKEEASNIIAHLIGLGIDEKGWTPQELAHLLYFKQKNTEFPLEDIPKVRGSKK
jgi:hypothetical protein